MVRIATLLVLLAMATGCTVMSGITQMPGYWLRPPVAVGEFKPSLEDVCDTSQVKLRGQVLNTRPQGYMRFELQIPASPQEGVLRITQISPTALKYAALRVVIPPPQELPSTSRRVIELKVPVAGQLPLGIKVPLSASRSTTVYVDILKPPGASRSWAYESCLDRCSLQVEVKSSFGLNTINSGLIDAATQDLFGRLLPILEQQRPLPPTTAFAISAKRRTIERLAGSCEIPKETRDLADALEVLISELNRGIGSLYGSTGRPTWLDPASIEKAWNRTDELLANVDIDLESQTSPRWPTKKASRPVAILNLLEQLSQLGEEPAETRNSATYYYLLANARDQETWEALRNLAPPLESVDDLAARDRFVTSLRQMPPVFWPPAAVLGRPFLPHVAHPVVPDDVLGLRTGTMTPIGDPVVARRVIAPGLVTPDGRVVIRVDSPDKLPDAAKKLALLQKFLGDELELDLSPLQERMMLARMSGLKGVKLEQETLEQSLIPLRKDVTVAMLVQIVVEVKIQCLCAAFDPAFLAAKIQDLEAHAAYLKDHQGVITAQTSLSCTWGLLTFDSAEDNLQKVATKVEGQVRGTFGEIVKRRQQLYDLEPGHAARLASREQGIFSSPGKLLYDPNRHSGHCEDPRRRVEGVDAAKYPGEVELVPYRPGIAPSMTPARVALTLIGEDTVVASRCHQGLTGRINLYAHDGSGPVLLVRSTHPFELQGRLYQRKVLDSQLGRSYPAQVPLNPLLGKSGREGSISLKPTIEGQKFWITTLGARGD